MIMNYTQAAELILRRWQCLKDEDFQMLRVITIRSLLDLHCLMQFGRRYEEMIETDEGLFKFARMFPDCLQHPKLLDRYKTAQREKDATFLGKFSSALRSASVRPDKRNVKSVGWKMFLYLNWFIPILDPELDQGLMVRSNDEILDILSKREPPVFLDLARLKVVLHRLKLKRLPAGELEKFRNTKLSNFLQVK